MSNWFRSEFDAYMAWSFIEDPTVAYDATFQESSASNEKSKVIQNATILDSGASKTVTGLSWVKHWLGLNQIDSPPELVPSRRRFKFGSQRTFDSLGTIILTGFPPESFPQNDGQPELLSIKMDVIDLDIPCLVSRETLFSFSATIDFSKLAMTMMEGKLTVPLRVTSGGHITFQWIHKQETSNTARTKGLLHCIYPTENAAELHLSEQEARKLHIQFGHASVASLQRICRLAHYSVSEALLQRIVQNCSCLRSTGPDERPVVNRRVSTFPGQTVVTDTFFPELTDSQRRPAVIFVCDFSKFAVAAFPPNMKPESYVNELLLRWIPLMGFPEVLLCDNATTFGGETWEALGHIFNMNIIPAPTKCPHQIGLAERHVAIIKQAYQSLSRCNADKLSRTQLMSLACVTKNLTPLSGYEVPPLMLVTGRSDLISRLSLVDHCEDWENTDVSPFGIFSRRLANMHSLRSDMIRRGAASMIKIAKSRVLRKEADSIPRVNSPIQVWDVALKVWKMEED